MPNQQTPILVLGPMASEIDALTAALTDAEETRLGDYRCVAGLLDGVPVVTVRTFIGMVHAAAATALAASHFSPRCVLIQGTAGAHDPALHRGDLVLGASLIEMGSYYTLHRDVGGGSRYEDYVFPGVELPFGGEPKRVRTLESDPSLLAIAEAVPYLRGRRVTGTISSGDLWNRELDVLDRLHRECGSLCEEMEGFAVAQVCRMLGLPMLAVRVISNSEWHAGEDFDESVALWCQEYCRELIAQIDRNLGGGGKQ
ncbi:MAG: 5'-methylthioadenosine/S-adenosylhomocysteine nucleosidase [Clostridia bacterium]|nr:5'-methylthioadenosine/S-adenosylhomocysteine nucleosidase [Clostridia bacterium]